MKKILIASLLFALAACGGAGSQVYDVHEPTVKIDGDGVQIDSPSIEFSPFEFGVDKVALPFL